MDESFALHEQVYEVLDDNRGDATRAISELMNLEESTRDRRRELNKELKKTLDSLSEKERKAFMEKAKKRYAEMKSRFVAVVKEYPEDKQKRIQDLVATLTR